MLDDEDLKLAERLGFNHDKELKKLVNNLGKLEGCLALLTGTFGTQLMRYKGVLHVMDDDRRLYFQGVQAMYGGTPGRTWAAGEDRASTLVFIGRDMPWGLVEDMVAACHQDVETVD